MATAPMDWKIIIFWPGRRTSEILILARRYETNLVDNWKSSQAKKFHQSNTNWRDKSSHQRTAHIAEASEREIVPDTTQAADPSYDPDWDEQEQDCQIFSVDQKNFQSSKSKSRHWKKPTGPPPFPKDDTVVSSKPPPSGGCYCCGSDKHWARDCKYYGQWSTRHAHLVHMEDEEQKGAYFVMLEESGGPTYEGF